MNKLRILLQTEDGIYLSTSSAFGPMEGALRNLVGMRCASFCNGAFSDKWYEVALKCQVPADPFRFEWGTPITAKAVDKALSTGRYDAITLIHNETSTGVMSPLFEIAEVLKKYPDVVSIIDTVSSMSALNIPIDELGIDCCIFGVQKAFALPPGLAVFTASDKALERARGIEGRGYYFDFLEFAKADEKHNTPSTPCISQIYALDAQLDRMFREGLNERFRRHTDMSLLTQGWALANGFELFPENEFCSRTLTCLKNNRKIDLVLLKKRLGDLGYAIDDGYGKIKGQTFRIAHMGDRTEQELYQFLEIMRREIFSI